MTTKTVLANEYGQIIEVCDMQGTYYYLCDSLGNPTGGGWDTEHMAYTAFEHMKASDSILPEPTVEIDDEGYRL